MCPFTKVEESFNMQAAHDILYVGPQTLEAFDHFQFPGVVPRTFVGIVPVAALSSPILKLIHVFRMFHPYEKIACLILVRGVLATLVWLALVRFERALSARFPERRSLGFWFMILSVCQFHLPFYMSRTLPNTFGLALVLVGYAYYLERRWRPASALLALATLVFRCDILLLCVPVALSVLFTKQSSFVGFVIWGAICGIASVSLTVCVDSYFWNRWIWPEGEVFWFNTVMNQSSKWGTEVWHWYFTNALPRGLLGAVLLVPVGVLRPVNVLRPILTALDGDVGKKEADFATVANKSRRGTIDVNACAVLAPALAFVSLYSGLPHKELRFVMPVFPIFNAVAALGAAKLWSMSESYASKSQRAPASFSWLIGRTARVCVLALLLASASACSIFFVASYWNYPGGSALLRLQRHVARFDTKTSCHIHIDVASAMTGITRFLELHRDGEDAWVYSKAEHLVDASDFSEFTHLVTSTPETHGSRFEEIFRVEGFDGVDWRGARIRTSPKIYTMRRRDKDGGIENGSESPVS